MSGKTNSTRGRRRSPSGFRLRLPLLVALAVVLVFCLVILPDLIAPEPAKAIDLPGVPDFMNPAQWAEDALKKAGTEATSAIQDSFFWMMNQIFGGVQAALSVELLVWLTKLPDFSQGQVGSMERSVQVAAGAFLGCILTLSIVRFWLGSYTSSGGVMAGLEGVWRTAFAALMIGLWPRLFDIGVKLSNAFSSAILHDGVKQRLENLFQGLDMASLGLPAAGGAGAGAIGIAIGAGISLLMWIIIAFASVVLFMGLVVMKIIITAGTVLVFVVMPLALVLWPLPETSWIANALAKTCAVLLAIPVLWILVFGAASAIGADIFFLSNNGTNDNFLQTGLNILLVKPLVACALLYMAIVLPTRLLKMAPITGSMGRPGQVMGAAKTMATYAGYKKVTSMVGSSASPAAKPAAAGAGAGGGSSGPGKAQGSSSGTAESAAAGSSGSKQTRKQAEDAGAVAGAGMTAAAASTGGAAAAGVQQSAAAGRTPAREAGASAEGGAGARVGTAAVAKFESANGSFVDQKSGGPAQMMVGPEYRSKVGADQKRMNSMPESERPKAPQVQSAWSTLEASPSAQGAISRVSADPVNQGKTAPEVAAWSNDSQNPYWGAEAQQATRTIGEASPFVREHVVTEGQGYSSGGGGGGGKGGPPKNGGGDGNAAAPRTPKVEKPEPTSTSDYKKPPTRQVSTRK